VYRVCGAWWAKRDHPWPSTTTHQPGCDAWTPVALSCFWGIFPLPPTLYHSESGWMAVWFRRLFAEVRMFSIASMGWSLTDQSFSPFQDRDHASPQPAKHSFGPPSDSLPVLDLTSLVGLNLGSGNALPLFMLLRSYLSSCLSFRP
jgi:hypothetical protein